MQPKILTHRGLDPSRQNYFAESSREAFEDHLSRGFGLEFDIQPTKDGSFIVIHDDDLERISRGKDKRKIRELTLSELLSMDFDGSHLISLPALFQIIKENRSRESFSALHLKHATQETGTLEALLEVLNNFESLPCIMFDVKIQTAQYLKGCGLKMELAPSVAHPYDIERYSSVTGNTLYAIDEIIPRRDLFSWVWLDEWDLADRNGGSKHLYEKNLIENLRGAGFSIAVVSPELHSSSPGLLGGEAHPDAQDGATLEAAMKRIISLSPDAICTDYPDLLKKMSTV